MFWSLGHKLIMYTLRSRLQNVLYSYADVPVYLSFLKVNSSTVSSTARVRINEPLCIISFKQTEESSEQNMNMMNMIRKWLVVL